MKLVIATEEGDAYFGLLDGISNLDVVRVKHAGRAARGDRRRGHSLWPAGRQSAGRGEEAEAGAVAERRGRFPDEPSRTGRERRGALEHPWRACPIDCRACLCAPARHLRARFPPRSTTSASISGAGKIRIASRARSWAARLASSGTVRSAGRSRSGPRDSKCRCWRSMSYRAAEIASSRPSGQSTGCTTCSSSRTS